MNHNQAISLYSQIFNIQGSKNSQFYKSIFTTPIHSESLLSVLVSNSEFILNYPSHQNVWIIQAILENGIRLLEDAVEFPHDEEAKASKPTVRRRSTATSLSAKDIESIISTPMPHNSSSYAFELDDGGDDITALNGNLNPSSEFDDGDDITNLKTKSSYNQGTGISGSATNITTRLRNPSLTSMEPKEFIGIDEGLRIELTSNILSILKVWFTSVSEVNDKFKKRRGSNTTSQSSSELLTNYFGTPGNKQTLDDSYLLRLLTILKWYLNKALLEIEVSNADEFANLIVLKEILFLLSEILRSIYSSILFYKEGDNEFTIIQSLLFTFYKVNFSKIFSKMLDLTNAKKVGEGEYEASKIRLSLETLTKLYSISSILVMIPDSLIPVNPITLSSDITNMQHESPNPYEQYLQSEVKFDQESFYYDISSRLIPILAIDFNYCYQFRPDIMVANIQSGSFLTWFTGSRFNDDLYITFDTVQNVTNIQNNYQNLSITKSKDDSYLSELFSIYTKRIKKQQLDTDDDELHLPELLPITMLLFTNTMKNQSFTYQFTNQIYPIHHHIEDIVANEDTTIETFDIWLSILSYVCQYQYKSPSLQLIVKLSLIILLRLIKTSSDNLKVYKINEFKWKLTHQKSPIIPTNNGKLGIKGSLFYILDIIQNLIRFNLTNKLNVVNFRLSINIIYQIVDIFKRDSDLELGNYNWKELFITIFNLLNFIKRQNLFNSKYFIILNQVDQLKAMIEEILLILDQLLIPRFNQIVQINNIEDTHMIGNGGLFGAHTYKSINYDLIYHILLNYEMISRYLSLFDSKRFKNLTHCLQYFENEFYLTEESKKNGTSDSGSTKLDLFDHDFDSPVLIKKIQSFTLVDVQDTIALKDPMSEDEYTFKDTLKYTRQERVTLEDEELFKLFQSLLSLKLN
ncbi:hypothetical protein DFJ63DRAFT_291195 [Scheffersomyces coipomensis]|uniref:uncharacterized protein n=1 Tax=Scheffersomyces coipomensis TaxID=1788519 RepID=UPI00315E0055